LKDRNYKGEDYKVHPKIAQGPMQDRRCTDVLFCLLFNAVLGVMLNWCINGYVNDNPDMLLAPISGANVICGYGTATGYPYLYIADLSSAISNPTDVFDYGVCVESCPTEANTTISCTGQD